MSDASEEFALSMEFQLEAARVKEMWVVDQARIYAEIADKPGSTKIEKMKAKVASERLYWVRMERETAEERARDARERLRIGVL